MSALEDMFAGCIPPSLDGVIDGEDMIEPIDMDEISDNAVEEAEELVATISNLQNFDADILNNNPKLKKRLAADSETLRVLIKMRRADEVTHDILIKAISGNSGNASLYRALSEMQKTILQITTKIQETMHSLQTLLKDYQLELNFEEEIKTEKEENIENTTTHRGSKDFIIQQLEKNQDLIK